MARARRRVGAVALAVLALVAFAPATSAADPPPGVAFNANVTVTVREADSSVPIGGATVRLVAAVTDFPGDELQSLTGTTDADGRVAFSGVARADDGAPPVHLAAMAHRETSSVDPAGCRTAMSWDGLVPEVVSSDGLAIPIAATPTSSISCAPRLVLHGAVHDRAGHPIHVRLARASIVLSPSGKRQSVAIRVAASGAFTLTMPRWGPDDTTATVTVRIVGRVTRHLAMASGCMRDLGQVGRLVMHVASGDGDLPRLDVVTQEAVLGERCGLVGTPRPPAGATATGHTLPPTDALALLGHADHAPAMPWAALALGVMAFAVAISRPFGARAGRVSRPRT